MPVDKIQNNPTMLIILDGWGISSPNPGNAITLAKTPTMNALLKNYPNTLLGASGKDVGLPPTQHGNSEAGHLNLGAGRIVQQDSLKIAYEINKGDFFRNPAFVKAVEQVKKYNSSLHLMGLMCNEQSAHAYPDHLLALLMLARRKKVKKVYLHLFTDGRDSPPYAAVKLLYQLNRILRPAEKIATVSGRFYAMDRIKKWERTEAAYNAMLMGQGLVAQSAEEAILQAYNRGESDEFVHPTVIVGKNKQPLTKINNKDAIIFFNLRSDRARQLAKPFVQKDFEARGGFIRAKKLKNIIFVAMTNFGPDLDHIATAYPSSDIYGALPQILHNRHQLYIAEKEKYAHVTYFFNGGFPEPIGGEERMMLPSLETASYADTPEMSANEITDALIEKLDQKCYNFITVNYANPDMLGHTGNLTAGIKAVETVDACLGRLLKTLAKHNGQAIITADHGNAEQMIDLATGEINTEHSSNPVPCILYGENFNKFKLKNTGVLGDIAPTILEIMEVEQPKEMTGTSLIIK